MLRSGLQRLLPRRQSYKLVDNDDEREQGEPDEDPPLYEEAVQETEFSWLVYSIFLLMGVAMLWAWNAFLAAAPYFHLRFAKNEWVRAKSQASITSVSTVTSLCSYFILVSRQKNASYPRRIISSLVLTSSAFTLLAASALLGRNISTEVYFVFVLAMVFVSSLATSLSQNGLFAYVAGFAQARYTQAIMAGQAVAGVLPCIVQVISVLAVPEDNVAESEAGQHRAAKSAFAYFGTATGVGVLALLAFLYLLRRQNYASPYTTSVALPEEEVGKTSKNEVPLLTLFGKLRWTALAIYICFTVTMVFPVFTAKIESVRTENPPSRFFRPAVFIPIAFLFWNVGDLIGRVAVLLPALKIIRRPFPLFLASLARLVFIPLYMMCNVGGAGAQINSDFFYLVIVQGLFGITNGYICSMCMMGASEMVEPEEREAAGGFMGLMLVGGLTTGSLLSFLIGGVH